MADFTLTRDDRATGLWTRLRGHLEEKLATARVKNDDETLTEQQTAALRGRINCLKALLALGTDRPVILTGDED